MLCALKHARTRECGLHPQEAIERAGFVLGFVGHWETALRKAAAQNPKLGATVKDNFLTSETKQDVIIAMNNVILMAKCMRNFCLKNKVGDEWVPVANQEH